MAGTENQLIELKIRASNVKEVERHLPRDSHRFCKVSQYLQNSGFNEIPKYA
jgi:hypothetical protein